MQPMILAYRLPAKQLSRLRMLAMKAGARVRVVEKREYLDPIGSFCAIAGAFDSMYDGEDLTEPMLVLAQFQDAKLSAFLQAMRASTLQPIALKAVLTETNAQWNSLELYEALREERDAMQQGASAPVHEANETNET